MSTGLSGFPVRLANCSGLANSGVPTKAPSVEIGALERDSSITFASPRSMIFAVILPSARLTMMLVGLMSRCTRFWFWMAVNPAATCATISSAKSVSNFPQRLISFSSVSPPSRGSSSNRFCPSVTPRQHWVTYAGGRSFHGFNRPFCSGSAHRRATNSRPFY